MASTEESWIGDIINDFIHSSIWLSPIQTFIDSHCACFDYDEEHEASASLLDEQKHIYKQYETLAHLLLTSLSEDLKLDMDQINEFQKRDNSVSIDESYEQLYSMSDFSLFTEMMKRRNLVLQLQALVKLQLECGILKQTDAEDDRILQLLMKATSSAAVRSLNKPSTGDIHVRRAERTETIADVRRQRSSKETRPNDEPTTIESVPEQVLLEKLKDLTVTATSSISDKGAPNLAARQNFLKQQRDLLIQQQRNERVLELEKEAFLGRPQSATKVARRAMETVSKQDQQISNDELEKRRAIAAKLRREVIDKR